MGYARSKNLRSLVLKTSMKDKILNVQVQGSKQRNNLRQIKLKTKKTTKMMSLMRVSVITIQFSLLITNQISKMTRP